MAGGDIQGAVTDASGNPISGLTIYLINEANPNVVTTTTTDANGNYQFDDHPDAQTASDTYHVVAAAYDDGTDLFNTFSKPQVAADFTPFFDVSISSTNDPVTEGNDLNVDYAVSNTGDGSGTQDITLEIDNTQEAVDSGVTIASGGSTTGTLTWNTVDGEAGSYTATVASADDSVSTGVSIEEAIPDSAIHQYDATKISGLQDGEAVSSITDQIGDTDASASGDPTYAASAINGNPAVDLDGDGDYFTVDFSQAQSLSILAVADVRGGGNNYIFSSDNSGEHPQLNVGTDDTIIDFGNSQTISNNDESGLAIWTSILDGANSIVRRSATGLFSGDAGSEGVSSLFRMGERNSDSADMLLGEYIVYDTALSQSTYESEETRLADKWGITI